MGRIVIALALILGAGCGDAKEPVDAGVPVDDAGHEVDGGASTGPYDCDESNVLCDAIPPICSPGEVAEVSGACWTWRCVPVAECFCSSPAMCPDPGTYTCHNSAMRCGPYL